MRALFLIFVLAGVVLAQDVAKESDAVVALRARVAELEKRAAEITTAKNTVAAKVTAAEDRLAELEPKLEAAQLDAAAKAVEISELKEQLAAAAATASAPAAPKPIVRLVVKTGDGVAGVFTYDPVTGAVTAALANEGELRQEVLFGLRQVKPDGTTVEVVGMRSFAVAPGGVDAMSRLELTAPRAVELTILTGRAAALYERERRREAARRSRD